ncbi:MAG: hypothetical protein ABFD77_07470 [Thermotogota bacterium]
MIRRLAEKQVLLALALLAVLTAAQGCGIPAVTTPGTESVAEVQVTEDPKGGLYITKLSCTFQVVTVSGGALAVPATLRVKWVAACGVHKTETFQFTGGEQIYMTMYLEAGGSYIAKTLWVEITWEDAEGSHRIESAVAECSI